MKRSLLVRQEPLPTLPSSATRGRPREGEPLRVVLVDLSGETNILYTPLAALSLRAAAEADARLLGRVEIRVLEFTQAHTSAEIVKSVVASAPHVVAMSCQGWNIRQLSATFSPLRQFLPEAILVLGGNHVSHRGSLVLPAHPEVDVVVNGEGEWTFADLLATRLDGADLGTVRGLAFRRGSAVESTADRDRTRTMTELPSPYLLADVDFRRYDIALLETNRGCPYACGFCYWGGRIGQKIGRGEIGRARADLEVIGRAGIGTLFLCDANVGMLPEDIPLAHAIADTFRTFGAPSEVNLNWAKNNAGAVGDFIRILQDAGVHVPINVPLQTLSTRALEIAGRTERGRAEMIELARELATERGDIYCELIFGMPGESLAEFAAHYDQLYATFPNLRIHPLWLLPNTDYHDRRDALGIRTISPDPSSDYEAVVAHGEMTMDQMGDGLALLLGHSMLSLLGPARNALRLLVRHDGRSASAIVSGFEDHLAQAGTELARDLHALFVRIRRACYFERALRARKRDLLFRSRAATYELMAGYFAELDVPSEIAPALDDLLRFDCALLPRSELAETGLVESSLELSVDPVELSRRLLVPGDGFRSWLAGARPVRLTLAHRGGLAKLSDKNCDLTGSWHGRVVAREPAPGRARPMARAALETAP